MHFMKFFKHSIFFFCIALSNPSVSQGFSFKRFSFRVAFLKGAFSSIVLLKILRNDSACWFRDRVVGISRFSDRFCGNN